MASGRQRRSSECDSDMVVVRAAVWAAWTSTKVAVSVLKEVAEHGPFGLG